MPRTKFPPTPTSSTEPVAQDKNAVMENSFSLPPAAMNRSPPTSPVIQRKRTLSGSAKKEDLPPPPSRARKIIQMKPKEEFAVLANNSAKTTSPKRKQPSATSAAGRKIARKTAHSIIERRRRSKMNEEFGVLKDMIPACKGVDMHKLAILQAGIEYVKYLQGCIEKLQDDRGISTLPPRSHQVLQNDKDEDMEESSQASETPQLQQTCSEELRYQRHSTVTTAASNSTHTSPILRPNISSSSLTNHRQILPPPQTLLSTSPPPLLVQTPAQTGVSPAFNAIHFSPDLSRTYTSDHGKASPNILPLPQSAMPMGAGNAHVEGAAEATATAALMMLTNDRRGRNAKGGMSVMDLLSH